MSRHSVLALLLVASAGCRHPVPAGVEAELAPPGTRLLTAGSTTATVMDPQAPDRYNRGVRFTPLAAVLGARVDGHEFLYHPAAHDAIDDHGGLASEFDLVIPDDGDDLMPPGYTDAKVGEGFVKVGVGVLCKQPGHYSLFQHPTLTVPAVTTARWSRRSVEFTQDCTGTNGYAYRLAATVTVAPARITVDWTLTNTGTRPFVTRQYAHNFFRFDDRDVGPDYTLEFPYDFRAEGLAPQQRQAGRVIEFAERIPEWVNLLVPWPAGYAGPNRCVARHLGTGQSVACETSLPGLKTAIHARPAYLSPEQFVVLSLGPHETARWRRTYRFATAPGRHFAAK